MSGPSRAHATEPVDVAVIGGGLVGLASARELARGGARVVVLEAGPLGHARGGSGGPTRIFRVTYADRRYGDLARAARPAWDTLEREAGESLRTPTPFVAFGPRGGSIDTYARAIAGAPDVAPIDRSAARERFVTLRFGDADTVLEERGSAVVAAGRTLAALTRLARSSGVAIADRTPVLSIGDGPNGALELETAGPPVLARRAVVSAGAWTRRLAPESCPRLVPLRQTVAYLRTRTALPGPMPIWIRFGREANDAIYGLPTDRADVIKVARHVTSGAGDDPDAHPEAPDPREIDELRRAAARLVHGGADELVDWDSCLYTMTQNEHFVLGRAPADGRIVVATGFSGHGFKFGPLIGRAVAELALGGRLTDPVFAALAPSWQPAQR